MTYLILDTPERKDSFIKLFQKIPSVISNYSFRKSKKKNWGKGNTSLHQMRSRSSALVEANKNIDNLSQPSANTNSSQIRISVPTVETKNNSSSKNQNAIGIKLCNDHPKTVLDCPIAKKSKVEILATKNVLKPNNIDIGKIVESQVVKTNEINNDNQSKSGDFLLLNINKNNQNGLQINKELKIESKDELKIEYKELQNLSEFQNVRKNIKESALNNAFTVCNTVESHIDESLKRNSLLKEKNELKLNGLTNGINDASSMPPQLNSDNLQPKPIIENNKLALIPILNNKNIVTLTSQATSTNVTQTSTIEKSNNETSNNLNQTVNTCNINYSNNTETKSDSNKDNDTINIVTSFLSSLLNSNFFNSDECINGTFRPLQR